MIFVKQVRQNLKFSKGGVDIRVCEAFCAAIFSKNAQTFWFFGIVGGMCASSRYQSFRIQLNFLPAKLLASGSLIRWHKLRWKGTEEEKGIKKVNIEMFFQTKMPHLCYSWISKCKISQNCRPAPREGIFSFVQITLVSIFSCVSWHFKRDLSAGFW